MKKITLIILVVIVNFHVTTAQQLNVDALKYIEKYKDIAIKEMQRCKIPASITLAQGLLESGFGNSYLCNNTNNHFGIKCHETWTGKTFRYTDDAPNECFRVYDNPEQSYIDHSDFLVNRKRYAGLFVLNPYDYKGWAHGLKQAGYATNPKYPELLIKYIEDYDLHQYDSIFLKQPSSTVQTKPIIEIQKPTLPTPNPKVVEVENIATDIPQNDPKTIVKKHVFGYKNLNVVKIYKGESLSMIANNLNIPLEELLQYNDLENADTTIINQYIYLEPKHKKAKQKIYKIGKYETMWSVSQKQAIQLPTLLALNKLSIGEEPKSGSVIYLKKKAKEKPPLREIVVPKQEKEELLQPTNVIITSKNDVTKTIETNISDTISSNTKKISTNEIVDVIESESNLSKNPTLSNPNNSNISTKYHTVVKGDTAYNISKKYGVTLEQIQKWNNLPDYVIKLGMVLKIKE